MILTAEKAAAKRAPSEAILRVASCAWRSKSFRRAVASRRPRFRPAVSAPTRTNTPPIWLPVALVAILHHPVQAFYILLTQGSGVIRILVPGSLRLASAPPIGGSHVPHVARGHPPMAHGHVIQDAPINVLYFAFAARCLGPPPFPFAGFSGNAAITMACAMLVTAPWSPWM